MKMTCAKSRKPGVMQSAFSLVEVMVSVVILAVVFIGFYVSFGQGFYAMEMSRENLRATQLLQEKMETIRLYTWSQINTSGFVPTTFTAPFDPSGTYTNGVLYNGHISITNAPMTESYASNNLLVTVTLSWTTGSTKHKRKMMTLVSQYGLHNYYY